MNPLNVQIVNDEDNRPVAVRIPYDQWLEIRSLLERRDAEPPTADLTPFPGTVKLSEDPVAYQRRIRDEWS